MVFALRRKLLDGGILVLLAALSGCALAPRGAGTGSPAPAPAQAPAPAPGVASGALAPAVAARLPDIQELTVDRIQADYAAGRYTAVGLTTAFLQRIQRFDGFYNAFISLNPEALAIAAELDREYAMSGPRGPLHGVPVVIKDNMDYGGLVTTAGYSGFSAAAGGVDLIPDHDATAVARLRAAGAIVLGKTNLPDFAGHGTRTQSSVSGVTLNASNPDRAPGGSSGGTATAVNGNMAVLGLGTETGGSIQNPAAAQGLVGVKPSLSVVPLDGVVPIDATYRDVVGPLTRTVRDAALVMDVLAGPSLRDLGSYAAVDHLPEEGFLASLDPESLRGKRFGLVGLGWRDEFLPLEEETAALYRKAIEVLQAQGAEVVEDPFLDTGWKELYAARQGVPTTGAHDLLVYLQGTGPGAAFRSVEEWETLTGQSFRGGRGNRNPARPDATEAGDNFQAWRRDIRAKFREILAEHELDGLFFPQAGGPTRPLVEDPERPDFNPNNHPELPSNIINDIGLPVVAVPADHYADGMPFVVAFIGDLWADAQLMSWAYAFEQATRARKAPVLVEGR
jgi:amidase